MKKNKKMDYVSCYPSDRGSSRNLELFFSAEQWRKKWSLIYIPKTEDGTNDFWTSLLAGTRNAAREYNAELEILAPGREQDVERQIELLGEAIEKNQMQFSFLRPVLMPVMRFWRKLAKKGSGSFLLIRIQKMLFLI